MKRFVVAVVSLVVGTMIVGEAFAQAEAIGKLDIKAIKKMQFVEKGKDLYANNVIVFVNAGNTEARLRNAKFDVSLRSGDELIPMGSGTIADLTLPAASKVEGSDELAPSELVKEMPVLVGPKNDATIERLLRLFNVFGDPSVEFALVLVGECELGVPMGDKGWVYQKGIGVELEFKPTILPEYLSR